MRRSQSTVQRLMVQIAAAAFLIYGGLGVARGQPYHHLAIVLGVAIGFAAVGLAVSRDQERLEAIHPRPPVADDRGSRCRDFDSPHADS